MANVGDLSVRMRADTGNLTRGLDHASSKISDFSKRATAAGHSTKNIFSGVSSNVDKMMNFAKGASIVAAITLALRMAAKAAIDVGNELITASAPLEYFGKISATTAQNAAKVGEVLTTLGKSLDFMTAPSVKKGMDLFFPDVVKMKNRYEAIMKIVDGLKQQAATVGLNSQELVAYQLRQQNATEATIKDSMAIQESIDWMTKRIATTKALTADIDKLAERVKNHGLSEDEILAARIAASHELTTAAKSRAMALLEEIKALDERAAAEARAAEATRKAVEAQRQAIEKRNALLESAAEKRDANRQKIKELSENFLAPLIRFGSGASFNPQKAMGDAGSKELEKLTREELQAIKDMHNTMKEIRQGFNIPETQATVVNF